MNERRIGKRGEQKRRWEVANRGQCACGSRCARGLSRCQVCTRRAKREARDQRWREIQRLWGEGLTLEELARATGYSSVASMGATMKRMREDGWELPYRYAMESGRRVAA